MSYLKLPKLVQDSGLGFQTINQARDNIATTRGIYDAEHNTSNLAYVNLSGVPHNYPDYGQHNAPGIPKSVVVVSPYGWTVVSGITGVGIDVPQSGRVVQSVARQDVGVYLIATLALAYPWANAAPSATTQLSSSTVRKAFCRQASSTVNGLSGWLVTLLEQGSAGAQFTPADYDFHFRLWAKS